jgi:hypothetical protein
MPGVLRLSVRDILQKASDCREFMTRRTLPVSIDSILFHGLGVFTAGPRTGTHEKIEATQKIEQARPFWGHLHDDFNGLGPKLRGGFKLTDPQVGTEPTYAIDPDT